MIMPLPMNNLRENSLVTLTLPANYGYCILVAVGSVLVIAWKCFRVEEARIIYNVPQPIMYSENKNFNSIQRAHQNTLEQYPQFLTLLLVGGLDSPTTTAVGGAIYLLGRIAYALGYCTGDPLGKVQTCCGRIGMLVMMGTTTRLALKLLQIV